MLAPGFHARALCYHPNGRWLVLGEGQVGFGTGPLSVRVVDAATGELVRTLAVPFALAGRLPELRSDQVNAVDVSPHGRWLAAATRAGVVHRWDLHDAAPKPYPLAVGAAADGEAEECEQLAFAGDGAALFAATSGHARGRVVRWDMATAERTAEFRQGKAYGGLCVHPGDGPVYCNGPDLTVQELDRVTLRPGAVVPERVAFAVSPDGSLLAAGHDRRLVFWDTRERRVAFALREPNRETAVNADPSHGRFSPDGRFFVAVSESARHAYLFDLVTGERVADWRADEGTAAIAFDPTSQFLAVAGQARTEVM